MINQEIMKDLNEGDNPFYILNIVYDFLYPQLPIDKQKEAKYSSILAACKAYPY